MDKSGYYIRVDRKSGLGYLFAPMFDGELHTRIAILYNPWCRDDGLMIKFEVPLSVETARYVIGAIHAFPRDYD